MQVCRCKRCKLIKLPCKTCDISRFSYGAFLAHACDTRASLAFLTFCFHNLHRQPPISYDFVFLACLSFLSLYELSFSAFQVRQRHFIALLLIFVRKHRLIHCVSIYYRVFCEGCESKKCKTPVVCVRAYAREAHQRTFFTNDNIFSFVYHFFLLDGYDKGSDKEEIISDVSPKTWEFFLKTLEIFGTMSDVLFHLLRYPCNPQSRHCFGASVKTTS